MKVFVTGATGFIGSATVQELIRGGHQVLGLARHEKAVEALNAAGALVHPGSLQDVESLKKGAESADGVIHLGFIHDFSKFAENCEIDKKAIEAMASVLAGTNKPFVITSGTALISPGTLATEETPHPVNAPFPRVSEKLAMELAQKGLKSLVVRLSPTCHGDGDHGFIHMLINIAREKGVSGYIGEGKNRWSAVHRLDAGSLFKLAFEKGNAGVRFHGVAEEAVEFRLIAEAIGRGLGLPVKPVAPEHFGWFARFAAIDCPASSQLTRERLGWKPTHKTLLEDLEKGTYFKS